MHVRTAFAEGACGAVAFSWTDEWWRGGHAVDDWAFGLVDAERRPKPALAAVERAFAEAPFPADERARWPKVSVVVCAYNAADTIDDCLTSLGDADLSRRRGHRRQRRLARRDGAPSRAGMPACASIDIPNGGLSAARNVGLAEASGEIVAYTDADVRVDPDWLTYLVQPLLTQDVVGAGGPNVVPRRRSVDGAVRRARAGRPDARAARRSRRGTRARLQHGVPARRAAGDRRLQPGLPPRRRRRRRLLAAAGQGAADRLRACGARVASPSRDA